MFILNKRICQHFSTFFNGNSCFFYILFKLFFDTVIVHNDWEAFNRHLFFISGISVAKEVNPQWILINPHEDHHLNWNKITRRQKKIMRFIRLNFNDWSIEIKNWISIDAKFPPMVWVCKILKNSSWENLLFIYATFHLKAIFVSILKHVEPSLSQCYWISSL